MLLKRTQWLLILSLVLGMAMAPVASVLAGTGCTITTTIEDGRKFKADICVPNPGGGADYEMSFDLEFDVDPDDPGSLQNLTVPCVGFSVDVLDAGEIANIDSRLPDPANQAIDPALPLRVTIEPPVGCGLAFKDDYDAEFDATNLTWVAQSPYRLMKAPIGDSFVDITAEVTPGSVRSRGCSGTFSEFVMVVDSVQDYANEAIAAYADLGLALNDNALGPTARSTLKSDHGVSQAAFVAGNYAEAIARLDDLKAHCGVLGGPALPNAWRSARDLVNLEGELVSKTGHVRFLLGRLNGDP